MVGGKKSGPTGALTLLALGDERGLHIVNTEHGVLLQSIPFGSVSDVYWLNQDTVVFGTNDGLWATLSLDSDDLVVATKESLIRDFTPQECLTYRIDRCSDATPSQ